MLYFLSPSCCLYEPDYKFLGCCFLLGMELTSRIPLKNDARCKCCVLYVHWNIRNIYDLRVLIWDNSVVLYWLYYKLFWIVALLCFGTIKFKQFLLLGIRHSIDYDTRKRSAHKTKFTQNQLKYFQIFFLCLLGCYRFLVRRKIFVL